MNVCILALVIQHENRIFFASYYIVICVLSVCTIFFKQFYKLGDFLKERLLNIKCVL
jgi:hypothetical protein